jgi:hypothetical protein
MHAGRASLKGPVPPIGRLVLRRRRRGAFTRRAR